jgi:hypothetical protein
MKQIKKLSMPLAVLALTASSGSEAAEDKRYRKQVVKMACGAASYTLTSTCIMSGDSMTLNECKAQTLVIDKVGTRRTAILPELPREHAVQVGATGRDLKELFVVAWACSNASDGPITTLRYSTGGGSAEYSEAWSHYDKAGNLIVNDRKLTPNEVRTIERRFQRVPSILPE